MKNLLSKGQLLLLFYLFFLLLLLTSPFWIWYSQDSKPLEVLIIDKTVPDQTFREHKGLVWVLNNLKYTKSNKQPYSPNKDYYGFKPEGKDDYKIDELPENLDSYQVIYLADQYGVYKEEFDNKNQLGKRSEKIHGGLTIEETVKIENTLLAGNKTLIAEFNTFASPTESRAKDKISNLINVSWSGWIGRFFSDLSSDEVPVWVKENYERTNEKWSFKGRGIVLVDQNDFIVVLESKDLADDGALFRFNDKGKKRFNLANEITYQYWFDIVEARNEDEVLAKYQLPVKKSGLEKLGNYGIPVEFPAVIHHQNRKYNSYYFAGDFADEQEVPAIYQTDLLPFWKKNVARQSSFYWMAYVPMMKEILANGLSVSNPNGDLVESAKINGVNINSKTSDSYLQIVKDGKWEDLLVKGVNMGIAKPGYFPGEAAITKDEYARWFRAIGDMNANSIRIYTLHPPAFYEAFYEYNQTAERPLFLLHGAWVNEEKLIKTQDAYSHETTEDFQIEIKKIIDVIHGNAEIPAEKGHASGTYSYDISPYVLGIIAGIEWDPEAVKNTNEKNRLQAEFTGEYFYTKNASPFESWLARMMEYAVDYETKNYQWQHSISFTNWVTTDLLDHPAEPLASEDLVSVDPNHINKTEQFHGGVFASYHIYPYYPDFLNLDEGYANYQDAQDKTNNYAGYLHDLIQIHKMPVLVAEFGVPASRGLTHINVHGMNQGFHSEKEQGQINQRLYQSIVAEGYAGGLVFSWQDEWFKRTWNTMDYDDPDRRPYWSNTQTNEQRFGLLSFDPSSEGLTVMVDGQTGDWTRIKSAPIYEDSRKNGLINKVFVHSDEENVYVRLDYHRPINWGEMGTSLLLDTIDHQGQETLSITEKQTIKTNYGVDFVVNLKGEANSAILVDSYYDAFYFQYGHQLQMIEKNPRVDVKNNGVFHPIRLALNKKLELPEQGIHIPFQSYETGQLLFGNGNPKSKHFNSLTDVSISADRKVLELRIPWQLMNVKDPSQHKIIGDLWRKGLEGDETTQGIRIAVLAIENGQVSSFPQLKNNELIQSDVYLYQWKKWEQPVFQERLKDSYFYMKEAFKDAKEME